jgi:hypothetical protein
MSESKIKKRSAMILQDCEIRRKLDKIFGIDSNEKVAACWAHMQMQAMLDEARKDFENLRCDDPACPFYTLIKKWFGSAEK